MWRSQADGLFGAMAVERTEGLEEGFLCQVFRQLVVAHHPIDGVEHGGAVAAHELATRVFITLARPRQEIVVGCLGEIGGLRHTGDYGTLGSMGFRV